MQVLPRPSPLAPRPWALLLLLGTVTACKTFGGSGEVGEPDYAQDADTNLARGIEALESKNYLEAEKYFEHVRGKYPFLDAAKEAELRLADTLFARERFIESRDAYQTFVKIHPTHPKVDYAAFRAALTHYKEIPSDLFILPPSREKDQAEVRASLRAMNDFIRFYSDSKHVAEAKEIASEVRRRLAEHEIYVAEFYAKRNKWPAVAGRYETVVQTYAGLGFDEDAFFALYEAYTKMGDAEKAKDALKRLIERLPGTPAAARAQRLLGS